MAAIFQIRRGSGSVSLTDGELYVNKGPDSLQYAVGDREITLAKLDELNTGSLYLKGGISASGDITASNLYVSGNVVLGGTITIGDNSTDNLVVNADLSSSIIPNNDNSFDLGSTSFRYRNVHATSISGAIAATNGVISGSSQVIGILDSLNEFSGSQLTQNTALATISGSLISSASSAKTTNDSQDISITHLNTNSASVNISVAALNLKTGSYATTGSNIFIGNQIITGSLTISGSTTFRNIGPTILSGSVLVSGSINTDGIELEASSTETIPALNTTFNLDLSGSSSTFINKSLVLGNGKVLVAGRFSSIDGHTTPGIARLNSNGSIDTSFSAPTLGASFIVPQVYTFVTQSDDKIIVGGDFSTVSGVDRFGIARLNSNGTLDTSFTSQSFSSFGEVRDIAIQNDNKIIFVGSFPSGSRRVNSNGDIDTSLIVSTTPGFGDDNFYSVALLPSGSEQAILIGGDFQQWNTFSDYNHLVKLHPSGALDFEFAGTNLDIATGNSLDRIQKIKVTDAYSAGDNGYIYIAGRFKDTRIGPNGRNAGFARLTTDDVAFGRGAFDNGFRLYISGSDQNTPGTQYVNDFDFYDGNKILLGGSFTSLGNPAASYQSTNRFIIVDDSGDLISGFSSSTYRLNTGSVNSVTLLPNDNVLVGGTFTSASSPLTAREGLASLKLAGLGDVTTNADYSITANVNELLVSSSNTHFTGYVSASVISSSFVGDGSGLTGVTAGDVEFQNILNKPTLISGSSQLSGTSITDLTIINLTTINQTASIIFSSGSNKFGDFGDDTHQFTGSVQITGSLTTIGTITATSIDGVINATNGVISSSLQVIEILSSSNSFTSSTNIRLTNLESTSASVNTFVANLNIVSASVNTHTSSTNTRLDLLETSTGSLNSYTQSTNTRLNLLETSTGSLNTFSSSTNTRLDSLEGFESDVESARAALATYTASVDTRLTEIGVVSGSLIASASAAKTTNDSQGVSITNINSFSGSTLISLAELNSFSGSQLTQNGTLATYTGSVDTQLTQIGVVSGSLIASASAAKTTNDSQDVSISNLNSFTQSFSQSVATDFSASNADLTALSASVSSVTGEFSSSVATSFSASAASQTQLSSSVASTFVNIEASQSIQNGRLTSLETDSGSQAGRLGNLESFSSSIQTAITVSGSDITVNGNFTVTGTQTIVNSTTVQIGDSIIELNGSGAANGGLYVKDATAPNTATGSLIWDSTNDQWKAGVKDAESKILLAGGDSVVSSSAQIDITLTTGYGDFQDTISGDLLAITTDIEAVEISTTNLNSFTSSQLTQNSTLATYTASVDTRLNLIEIATASLNTSVTELNTFSGSQLEKDGTLATYTGSVNTQLTEIGVITGSLILSASADKVSITNLNSYTHSLKDAIELTGSSVTILGNLVVNGSITTLNGLVNGIDISASVFLSNERLDELESSSLNLNIVSASVNSFTASASGRLNNIESTTTSLNISVSNLNSFTGSQLTQNSNLATYTGSVNTQLIEVGVVSGSLIASASVAKTTNDSQDTSIANINTFSGSQITQNNTLGIYTASVENKFSTLSTYTASIDTRLNLIEIATASLNVVTASLIVSASHLYLSSSLMTASIEDHEDRIAVIESVGGITTNGLVSGSSQILITDLDGYTAYNDSILTDLAGKEEVASTTHTLISSSTQITTLLPSGVVSGSEQINSQINYQNLTSSIIPAVTNAFDLGSETHFWRDIYVSTGSIKFVGSSGTIVGTLSNTGNGLSLDGGIVTKGDSSFGTSSLAVTSVTGSLRVNGGIIATSISGAIAATNGVVSGSSQITYANISSIPSGIISGSSQITSVGTLTSLNVGPGAITGSSTGNIIPFYFANQAAFPSATTYHGAIAHSHTDGKMYFAHGGVWNELANANGNISGSSQVNADSITNFDTNVKDKLNADGVISGSSQIINADSVTLGTHTTGNYVATIAGTTNQITVAGSGLETAAITLSTPQDIHTSANPQFNSLGIGTAASTTTGEIRATGDITAFYSSDIRLKENIIPIENALEKVNQISGNTYDWKEGYDEIHSHKGSDVGVIAQEIEKILPQIVTNRDNGYKAVQYEKIIPLLIEAIKELSAKIDRLENK